MYIVLILVLIVGGVVLATQTRSISDEFGYAWSFIIPLVSVLMVVAGGFLAAALVITAISS